MGLWIRTQNKRNLLEIQNIGLLKTNKGYTLATKIFTSGDECTLGAYETEERALEVLDWIQGTLVEVKRSHKI